MISRFGWDKHFKKLYEARHELECIILSTCERLMIQRFIRDYLSAYNWEGGLWSSTFFIQEKGQTFQCVDLHQCT